MNVPKIREDQQKLLRKSRVKNRIETNPKGKIMAEFESARNTVIASAIGLAAGFLAVLVAVILLLILGMGLSDMALSESKPIGFFLQLVPNLCLACILGFSVWLQTWTRRLNYSWLGCTVAALAGALIASVLGAMLSWILEKFTSSPLILGLPLLLGTAGDFGGIGFYVGRRERNVLQFLLPALGIGAVLPIACWLILSSSQFSYLLIFAVPLVPILYFAIFHVFLDLLWRSKVSGDAVPRIALGGLRNVRAAVLVIFIGAPALAAAVAAFTSPLPNETYEWVRGDGSVLRAQVERDPKLLQRTDELGATLLHLAASGGSKAAVEILIEKGAEVNAITRLGETPLHEVAQRDPSKSGEAVGIAELLLKNKADPNASAQMNGTPLHSAAHKNAVEIVVLLLKNGARPDTPDGTFNRTALHEAAREGYESVAEALLKAGANINIADSFGETPLLSAVEKNRAEFVEFLIKNGADVNAHSSYKPSPLSLSIQRGFTRIAELLRAHGAKESPPRENQ